MVDLHLVCVNLRGFAVAVLSIYPYAVLVEKYLDTYVGTYQTRLVDCEPVASTASCSAP